jgi:hypothetical protein
VNPLQRGSEGAPDRRVDVSRTARTIASVQCRALASKRGWLCSIQPGRPLASRHREAARLQALGVRHEHVQLDDPSDEEELERRPRVERSGSSPSSATRSVGTTTGSTTASASIVSGRIASSDGLACDHREWSTDDRRGRARHGGLSGVADGPGWSLLAGDQPAGFEDAEEC